MSTFELFGLQVLWSFVVYGLVARWLVWPWLGRLSLATALIVLLLPHTMRHIGLVSLVGTVTDPALPREFSEPQAYGDLGAAVLAIASIAALRATWALAIPLEWVFNVWGTLDLLLAFYNGSRLDLFRYELGSFWSSRPPSSRRR